MEYVNFIFASNGKTLEKYLGEESKVIVPNGVEVIGHNAFGMSDLESIQLPKGVKRIESAAFYGCKNLRQINIPDTIEFIGVSAFYECTQLKSLNLPNKKISFADAAFRNTYFESFRLPDGTDEIRDNLFNGSMCLSLIIIPGSVKSIGQYSFNWCTNLDKVIIQEGVESIMHRAFFKALSLREIHLPATITTLGSYSFEQCEILKDVYVNWKVLPSSIEGREDLFSGVFLKSVKLHIPLGTLDLYKNHPSFSKFEIVEEN